jgi:predicted CXXCH cytochrome family protein
MRRLRLLAVMVGLSLILIALLGVVSSARAGETAPVPAAQDGPGDGTPNDGKSSFDARCLNCHAGSEEETHFIDGASRPVSVDIALFNRSRHGASNPEGYLSCYDCHGNYTFPHDDAEYFSARDFRLTLSQACESCHDAQASGHADSVHERAAAEGNSFAPVCVDCHGYHDVSTPNEPRTKIPATCAQCHRDVYLVYKDSVHGAALIGEGNPDVPSCIDCHGVHSIEDPLTASFRLNSPNLCGKCHADEELMAKYDISTDVFNTYVSDFHGTTVTLFQKEHPDEEVNKAVCFDCHGIHNIRPPDDQRSTVMTDNLLETCQQCHPDADESFSAAWMSHYIPSPEHYPVVFYVTEFYKFFIPGVLLMMLGIILPDILHRLTHREYEPVIDLSPRTADDEEESEGESSAADDAGDGADAEDEGGEAAAEPVMEEGDDDEDAPADDEEEEA